MDHTTDNYDVQAEAEADIERQSQVRLRAEALMGQLWQFILDNSPDSREARVFFQFLLSSWQASAAVGIPKSQRKAIPRTLRQEVMERDAYRCVLCGDWHDLQLDHITPVWLGGENTAANLRVLCGACNGRKGAKV